MSASPESVPKVIVRYTARCNFTADEDAISFLKAAAAPIPAAALSPPPATPSSSSSPVAFEVQSLLKLIFPGDDTTMREFLEGTDWREKRESTIELPWSTDGLPPSDTPPISHHGSLPPEIVVHVFELTFVTLPLIDDQGKAILPEPITYVDDDGEERTLTHCPVQTREEEEDADLVQFINSLKKSILDGGDINEEDEDAFIKDWFFTLIDTIERFGWPGDNEATWEEEEKEPKGEEEEKEATVEEEEKEAKVEEEEKEPKGEEEEWTCPICLEICEPDGTWKQEMPCCPQGFHWDCISTWLKRGKTCLWCRSFGPLLFQSAKGLISRYYSEHFWYPSRPEFNDDLLLLWHLLGERCWWAVPHDPDCKCGCPDNNEEHILA